MLKKREEKRLKVKGRKEGQSVYMLVYSRLCG